MPKFYSNSLNRNRSRQSNFLVKEASTYELEKEEKDRRTRNRSFIKQVKQKRQFRNLESDFMQLNQGIDSFIESNQNNDAKDKFSILLRQSDALFEKILDHLSSLWLNRQQKNKYHNIISEYRESFKNLKISYCDEAIGKLEYQNSVSDPEVMYRKVANFRHDLSKIIHRGINSIAMCFDESLVKISEIGKDNNPLYSYKTREIDNVFNTIATTYYKNKILSVMPDIAYTLESTRFAKAIIIVQYFQIKKHKQLLHKGFKSFRSEITRYYIDQCKLLNQFLLKIHL